MKKYIKVGFTAMRDPATGNFLPAVPLYIESTQETAKNEENLINDIRKVFAEKYKQYVDAGGLENHIDTTNLS